MRLKYTKEDSFLSPEETAKRLNLSTATVYKLINKNQLPCCRIGKLYRIPWNALVKLLLSGGNIEGTSQAEARIPDVAKRFLYHLKKSALISNGEVNSVYLFGSFARGENDAESDIDILVIVKDDSIKVRHAISKLSERAMDEYDYDDLLSTIVVSETHWQRSIEDGVPLYDKIQREGILLWSRE